MPIQELSHEDKVAYGEKHVDDLVAILKKALETFFPSAGYTVKVENRGYEDLQIIVENAGFSIDLDEKERKNIARPLMVPAWQVTGYKVHLASYWHPEEIEDVPLSVHHGHWAAVEALINAMNADNVRGWFDCQGEQLLSNFGEDN